MSKIYGYVIDRMSDTVVGRTTGKTTWEQAHHAAEALAKRKGLTGDRYAIKVD